ncbi:hypothetical protein [Bradyrhizobium ottawaense]|nr:hypothetical protein [Bradyrhizobium ottawaense]
MDAGGNELIAFGETKGQLRSPPEVLVLPNLDQVLCATVGDTYGDYRFVERWMSDDPPSPWHAEVSRTSAFDGTKVVVTVAYEDTPSIVPQNVTPRQARLALLGAGLLGQVEAAVEAAGGATKITWDYASVFTRTDPLILAIGLGLSLTEAQIDELFRVASSL